MSDEIRVGSVVFTTEQGLGRLARDFFLHGVITHPLILAHGRRPEHPEWYPPDTPHLPTHRGQRSLEAFRDWLRDHRITHFLALETPFNWEFVRVCRDAGVRSIVMPMHECMPAEISLAELPDLWLCPSELDVLWAKRVEDATRGDVGPDPDQPLRRDGEAASAAGKISFVPVPVPDDVPYRRRGTVRTFVHNSGNGGLLGRNGTAEVLKAMEYVRSDARLIVRSQEPVVDLRTHRSSSRIDWRVGRTVPFAELWGEGDAFLFPEKFNGLSLPLQEARAAGMLVMATDRFPMNTWLPREPLIRVSGHRTARCAGHLSEFEEAEIDPRDVAAKVDEWFGRDATAYSDEAVAWRETMSWAALGPKHRAALESA